MSRPTKLIILLCLYLFLLYIKQKSYEREREMRERERWMEREGVHGENENLFFDGGAAVGEGGGVHP